MIRRLTILLALLTLLIASVSCHRQELEEVFYSKALLPILINWESKAQMDIEEDPNDDLYSASVWLFPTSESRYQGDPLVYKLTNAVYDYIEVPIGVYDILVFNKTIGEFSSNVGFCGTDQFETFEYYTKPYLASNYKGASVDDKEVRLEPDLLAVWRSSAQGQLVVTLEMIHKIESIQLCRENLDSKFFVGKAESSKVIALNITPDDFADLDKELTQLVGLEPERLTHTITVEQCVNNLHSASSATGAMCGISSSVKMARAEYSQIQTAQYFPFDTKTITAENGKNGYMNAKFRVIGTVAQTLNPTYDLKTQFTLFDTYDDSYIYPTPPNEAFSFEVTDQIFEGEALMGLDKLIALSTCHLGDVTIPDISVGGDGFDVNVNGWDNEIIVPLILSNEE